MEKRNKTTLALVITVVILLAVFSGFGISIFSQRTPQVVLPTLTPEPIQTPASDELLPDGALRVEVTPETVQGVIATLTRPESYYRELVLQTYWGEERAVSTTQVWVDGGFTRVETRYSDGSREHAIVGDGKRYRWYDDDREYHVREAADGDGDIMQHIPTYEDILELEQEKITAAGYESRGGVPCIYVEAAVEELGYLERYWVSVEQGLLVSAETEKEGVPVLKMEGYEVETPTREDAAFELPDGMVLHQASP